MAKLIDYISDVLFRLSRVSQQMKTCFCPWIIWRESDITEQNNRSFMITE